MTLKLIIDFTNAVDPDNGERITRQDLEELFLNDPDLERFGVVIEIRER